MEKLFFIIIISTPILLFYSSNFFLPGCPCPPSSPPSLSPCFFIKTIHCELLWPPSETRRQPAPKEGEEEGRGQEGEEEGGRCLLGRFLPGQTGGQRPRSTLPSTSGKISFAGGSAEDRRTRRQRDRTGAAAAAAISDARDKVLTRSHAAC